MNEVALNVIGIVSIIVPLVLLLFLVFVFWQYIDRVRNTLVFGTACAGSERPDTPKELSVYKLKKEKITDKNGKPLRMDEYECLIACGQSMLLGGIDDEDLLLVKPVTDVTRLVFPSVLIIKRDDFAKQNAVRLNDYAEKKVCRSWALCDLSKEDAVEKVKECMNQKEFVELKHGHEDKFPSTDDLIQDFKDKRLGRYKTKYPSFNQESDENCLAIISTTFDTQDKKVHFSIHPARMIESEVYYSFHISEKSVA